MKTRTMKVSSFVSLAGAIAMLAVAGSTLIGCSSTAPNAPKGNANYYREPGPPNPAMVPGGVSPGGTYPNEDAPPGQNPGQIPSESPHANQPSTIYRYDGLR